MLKKFAIWAITFMLSWFVASLGWAEQGEAFLYIHLGVQVIIIIAIVILLIVVGAVGDEALIAGGISGVIIIAMIAIIAIILFTTWVATQLFNVDYFVAYQIMTFGQCLSGSSNKSNDD